MPSAARFDEQFDVVVVGSGGGSMCAALVARDAGQTAVVLEKQDKVGGSTGISLGVMWIPDNPLMAREGVTDSYARAREYFDACVTYDGPGTTPARREAFLRSGPEMVSFLEGQGMRFERVEGFSDYYDELPGGEPRGRVVVGELFDLNELGAWRSRLAMFTGMPVRFSPGAISKLVLAARTWEGARTTAAVGASIARNALMRRDVRGGGAALQGRMLQLALRAGVDVRTQSAVTDLIVEDGRVVGVAVDVDGERRTIGARRAVLINAGGFSRNADMREHYGPGASAASWTMANRGDTGEMMEAAIALGAATDAMDEAWWIPTSLGPGERFPDDAIGADGLPVPFIHHMDISLPHVIVVDQDGNRFTDESASYMEKGARQYERQRQTGRALPAWAIIDRRHHRRYPWGPVFGPKPRRWLRTGYMKRADTLEDLASECGIDASGLRRTVERWNRFCATGVDADYGRGGRVSDRMFSDPRVKPNPNLGTIARGPFHAVAIYPSDLGTCGGLVTDEDARVLREDGSAIDGLYATGNSTASVMGRVYPCGGASIAASFVFGYRAAKDAIGAGDHHEPKADHERAT